MDAAQWTPQGIGIVKEVEISSSTSSRHPQLQPEKRARPNYKEQSVLNCPRCNSTNTKFCYYNNYSHSQPRYFCKTCRRYWTEGGSLRNVPVGGGSRKNKRSSSSSSSSLANSSSSTSTTTTKPLVNSSSSTTNYLQQPTHHELIPTVQIPLSSSKFYQGSAGQDLNLSFPNQSLAHLDQIGAASANSISALELLRSGISARGFAPFAAPPPPGSVFGAHGFGFQELMRQSNLKLPLEHHHGGFSGNMHNQMQEGGAGRVLFPFEDLKQVHVSNGGHHEEQEENGVNVQGEGDPAGLFWNGGNGRGGGTW